MGLTAHDPFLASFGLMWTIAIDSLTLLDMESLCRLMRAPEPGFPVEATCGPIRLFGPGRLAESPKPRPLGEQH